MTINGRFSQKMTNSNFKTKNLLRLPEELICKIAFLLCEQDFVNLFETCKYLKNLLSKITKPSSLHYYLWTKHRPVSFDLRKYVTNTPFRFSHLSISDLSVNKCTDGSNVSTKHDFQHFFSKAQLASVLSLKINKYHPLYDSLELWMSLEDCQNLLFLLPNVQYLTMEECQIFQKRDLTSFKNFKVKNLKRLTIKNKLFINARGSVKTFIESLAAEELCLSFHTGNNRDYSFAAIQDYVSKNYKILKKLRIEIIRCDDIKLFQMLRSIVTNSLMDHINFDFEIDTPFRSKEYKELIFGQLETRAEMWIEPPKRQTGGKTWQRNATLRIVRHPKD